ncbi:zinc-binding protein A33-like [Poecilia reticulata]|uniref:zinc-binding protein A33-like n=1 Tax=Poecilia reticulata TaxID=8081 RepID=UPI0007EA6F0A|nr:PREDICTED: zinc-binding protein A33-like [Poecilia reticulata]
MAPLLQTVPSIQLNGNPSRTGCMLSPNPMSTPADCCICRDEFTSPASLPCGHSFCLECIGEYWRISESCQCPLCMAVFPKRPQLKTERTESEAEPLKAGEVPCDVCPSRRAAVRSCLACLASYCSAHLEPHYQREDLGRHLLVSVAKNLEDSVCRLHGRKLEKFCRSDRTCICATCAKTEHRGHHVVSVNKEAAKNKTKLKRRRLKLQQEIQEKLSVAEDAERTAGLHGGELPAELWVQTRKLVKQLEEEISELQERNAELEQLLQTEDNLHFLQRFLHSYMTATAKSVKDDCFLEKHLTCPICMETFTDPVTTSCGHSFCMRCLELSIASFQVDDACPLCKKHLRKAPKVNNVLRDIVQEVKNTLSQTFTGAAGEVPCDACTVPKKKAEKSCLVCVASFCSTHLENHYSAKRLKGHKLVEPVENLDTRACPTHGCPLELYCRKRQTCVCARCLDGDHGEVVSAEEEWQEKKNQIEDTKAQLQERIMTRKAKIDEINEALKSCKEHVGKEWWDIDALFTAVLDVVKAAKAEALNPLEDKLRLLNKESKNLKDELEDEINKLETTISKLNDISALEDHILFLQMYPSLSVQDVMKDWTYIELDTTLSFGSMRETATMIENIQQQLEKLATIELARFTKFEVDVRLDPDTAHRRLVVSDDRSKVRDGGENQEVADSPKRYDVLGSVLGVNALATGKSYWEVEVGSTNGWDLGVARGSANRRGRPALNPDNGYWVLVHFEECDVPKPFTAYAVMTAPPVSLSFKDQPKKVGVFVDYKEGIVSFYDVTARSHIYSFSKCSFQDELHPFFSLHMKNEINFEPLIISKINHTEMN